MSQKVNTINIPVISEKDIKEISPSDNTSSIYENTNFYMFQLSNKKEEKPFNYSIYIQKPNNTINFFHTGNYGTITTDVALINISVQQYKEDIFEILQVERKDNVKRFDNYKISDIIFQTYCVEKENSCTYTLISENTDGYMIIYSFHTNDKSIQNYNYLSHIILK